MKSRAFMVFFIGAIFIAFPATSRAVTLPMEYTGELQISVNYGSGHCEGVSPILIGLSTDGKLFADYDMDVIVWSSGPNTCEVVPRSRTSSGTHDKIGTFVLPIVIFPGELVVSITGTFDDTQISGTGSTTTPNGFITVTLSFTTQDKDNRLEPFEAELEVGESITFVMKDGQDQTVDPSSITWSVIKQKSINPFIYERNTKIGTVDATGKFNGAGIGTCEVRAVTADNDVVEAYVKVRCSTDNGDLTRLRQIYAQRIPQGPIQKELQAGTLIWPFSAMNPGYANNLLQSWDARYSNFTCGGYQGDVLEFLHTVQTDPQECSLLNGFEFGPIQGSMGGHHAVVVYPKGVDWKTQGVVFDPWYHQRPETFSIDVWKQKFSPIAGDTSPTYRLEYPTTQDPSDFDTDVWRAAEALVEDLGQVAGVLDCPVNLLLRDGQGRRSGVDAGGAWHVEIPDTFFMRMPDDAGGYEWYFRLNGEISSYAMEITGIDEGSFQLTTASPSTGSAYGYEAQQISTGKTASAVLSSANPSPPLTTPNGGQITPNAIALPEGCWLVADDLGILVPRAALGGGHYTFRLDYSYDLFWELNLESLGITGSGTGIPVGSDLSLPFPCAEFGGNQYSFTMRYDHGLFWRLDLQTFKAK
jgi:hypothetical protein